VPGLGEMMTFIQMRHAKLWFAGEAENWPLAAYELDELKEGFNDAVRLHPSHEGVPVADLLPKMTEPGMLALAAAVRTRDRAAFETGFDRLTLGCNTCHETAHHGFNVVRRPATNPFPNQDFTPKP